MVNYIELLFIDDLLFNYLDDFCNNVGVFWLVFLKNFYIIVVKMGEFFFELVVISYFVIWFSGCFFIEDDFLFDNDCGDWFS